MHMAAPTQAPPLVDVQSLRVHFGTFLAVNDVNLTLRGGDLLGLIGPNGAGKTTLLRAIAGLQPTAAGRVRVLGEVLEPGAPVMARVGLTPDTPPLYDEMTVRTFLRFVARSYGLGAADVDAHISYWLEKVWLAEKAGQKVKSLSRGMRQRLGLARTLLPNPSVVLLDEPAAGLDPAGRVQFRKLLCQLRDQGKALVVSSHILADMNEYCTHIGIMERGALLKFGTVSEITGGATVAAGMDRRRYRVTLARVTPGLRERVEAIDGVSAVDADADTFTVEWGHTPEEAAKLLAELVARGLPVASFAAQPFDLEQAYLRAGVRQVD